MVVEFRESGMHAKTAVDKSSSLGAGSEKQTWHQATGSVQLGTKGTAMDFFFFPSGLRRAKKGIVRREDWAGDEEQNLLKLLGGLWSIETLI